MRDAPSSPALEPLRRRTVALPMLRATHRFPVRMTQVPELP